jgi:hypothetical protein
MRKLRGSLLTGPSWLVGAPRLSPVGETGAWSESLLPGCRGLGSRRCCGCSRGVGILSWIPIPMSGVTGLPTPTVLLIGCGARPLCVRCFAGTARSQPAPQPSSHTITSPCRHPSKQHINRRTQQHDMLKQRIETPLVRLTPSHKRALTCRGRAAAPCQRHRRAERLCRYRSCGGPA